MSIAVILLVFSAGSAYAAAYHGRRYEEALPLTLCVTTATLYAFGWFGQLRLGVYAVLGVAACLYACSLYGIVRRRNARQFLRSFVTPAFLIFLLLAAIAYVCNYGRLACSWDEFTHWADVVKAMRMVNGLSTHPDAHSMFSSYPPAMALLQYLGVTLCEIFPTPQLFHLADNAEWPLYFIYLTVCFALFMPFLKGLRFRKPLSMLCSAILVFLLPGLFCGSYGAYRSVNSYFYSTIYIDTYLGLLSGFCLSWVFCMDLSRPLERCTLALSLFVLVLVKDAALLFAVFCLAALCLREGLPASRRLHRDGHPLQFIAFCTAAVLMAKLSWSLSIHLNQAQVKFSDPYHLRDTLYALFGISGGYKIEVVRNFGQHLLEGIRFPIFEVPVSYYIIWAALLAVCIWGCSMQKGTRYAPGVIVLLTAVYSFGLLITYMNKFSEYEALELASADRYLSILLTALAFIGFAFLAVRLEQRGKHIPLLCLALVLLLSPHEQIAGFLTRQTVQYSLDCRERFNRAADSTLDALKKSGADSNDQIYFISQETDGYNQINMRYALRPYRVSSVWSIGQPFYEGDRWTQAMSLDEWKRELEAYSYILLWQINPYFTETYGELFEDEIVPQALYRKTDSGTFRRVMPAKIELFSFSGEKQGDSDFMEYADVAGVFDQHGAGEYTFEIDMKTSVPALTTVYLQNGGSSRYAFSQTVSTTDEYETCTFTADVSLSDSSETEAWLAFYTFTWEGTEAVPSVRSVRILKDGWAWNGE